MFSTYDQMSDDMAFITSSTFYFGILNAARLKVPSVIIYKTIFSVPFDQVFLSSDHFIVCYVYLSAYLN